MKTIFNIILYYFLITFNISVIADEKPGEKFLKIGVLAPLSGEFKDIGNSVLYSANLALHDIGEKNIKIFPKDSGSNKEKILKACEEFQEEGIKIVIGPVDSKFIKELNKFDDLIFLSLSNMDSEIKNNVIMMGINLESQLLAIQNFINKNKRNKTIILYPNNEFSNYVEREIGKLSFKKKLFKYSEDPKVLTKQIEKLTNYNQRKINLESRIKKLEKNEDSESLKELNLLNQKHTLGNVNFDSVIIIVFGNGLKSVLTSLAYTDALGEDILIITANQWFNNDILSETSINNFYFPSINLKNFIKFNSKFNQNYNYTPPEIAILAYDSIGLLYYFWKNDVKINATKDFNMKREIKAKIGKFKISQNKIIQKLEIYKLSENKFIKSSP